MSIDHLPAELVRHICGFVNRKDLFSVSRVSKRLNIFSNLLLYESITLTNSDKAFACCKTLANSRRSLAGYVRSFSMDDFPPWGFSDYDRRKFRECMIISIYRMCNLVHFRCVLIGSFGQDMCAALKKHKALRSLTVSFPHFDPWSKYSTSWPEDVLKPTFPELESFAFTHSRTQGPICPVYLEFILHILRAHSGHLRALHLPDWLTGPTISKVIPLDIRLPALTSLTILSSALSSDIVALQLPNVRSLTFAKYEPNVSNTLPSNVFLSLTHFSGSCRCLKDVLSTERPLRYVFLDGAAFDMNELDIFAQREPPQWRDVIAALKKLTRSSGPTRHLRFYVRSFHVSSLEKGKTGLTSLESLTICVRYNINDIDSLKNLGRKLFQDMPKLHTFLLSDEPYYVITGKRFKHALNYAAQRTIISRWSKHCPTLRRISFTADFVWDKTPTGWEKTSGPRGMKDEFDFS